MATVLGKRKSRIQKADPSVSSEEVQAKLARFFEAQFKPLFPTAKPTPTAAAEPQIGEESASDSDGSNDDSWGGFSEDEAEDESSTTSTIVEVVSHTDTHSTATNATLDKRESRAWLSSRPPVPTSDAASSSINKKGKSTTTDEDAPSLLKNDLALQRLLAESHLFSSASIGSGESGNAMEHVGRNRHLATDLRLSALGSKTSIYKQAKMPMSFRKGIQATAEEREAKRRREARENGIVLERPAASSLSKKAAKGRRNGSSPAIDAPAVGRMNNGMLKLSKKDIADIEDGGPRKRGAFTKKRRR